MMNLKDNSYNREIESPKKRLSLERKQDSQSKKEHESPAKKL